MMKSALLVVLLVACPACASIAQGKSGFLSESNARNRLLEESRSKAGMFENSGQLREAIEQWWIVDALSGAGSNAKSNIARLEDRSNSLVVAALDRAKKARAQGKMAQAQQAYLMVLQLAPAHADAMAALREMETTSMLKELKKRGAEGPAAAEIPIM
jgi:hypothetical protein